MFEKLIWLNHKNNLFLIFLIIIYKKYYLYIMSNLVTYYNFSKDSINGTYNETSNKQYAAYLINKVSEKVDATILSNISDLGFDRNGPNGNKCIWIHENNKAYIKLNPITSTNNGISFATWIYCESGVRTWARIFDFGNGAGQDNILMAVNGNAITIWVFKNEYNYNELYNVITDIQGLGWFHVVWTLNPNGDWIIYLNGILLKKYSNKFYPASIERRNMYIGKSNWEDPYFSGYIADFRIYDSVLNQNDVMNIYSGSSKAPEYDKNINWKWIWSDSKDNWIGLKENNMIGQWKDLGIDDNTNMTISFSIIISKTSPDWRNILHITNDTRPIVEANCCEPGKRIPALWIWPNDTKLHYRFSSQDSGNNGVDSMNGIGLNKETYITITISRSIINIYYNGKIDNLGLTNWYFIKAEPNAKIYIADPWYPCNNFVIKNLRITNGNIYEKTLDITNNYDVTEKSWVFPKSNGLWYQLSAGSYYTKWSMLGIKSVTDMTISFLTNIFKISDSFRSIIHVSNSGSNWGKVGDRIPGIWLWPNYNELTNKLYISFSTDICTEPNSIQELINTNTAIPMNQEVQVDIIIKDRACYVFFNGKFDTVGIFTGNIIKPNDDATVYICDPWHDNNGDSLHIKDFKIMNGNKINPPDKVGVYSKKGCFRDNNSPRAIPNYRGNVSNYEECEKLAINNYNTVFGMQNGGECWTGDSNYDSEKYGVLPEYNCIQEGKAFGGEWSQFVYQAPDHSSPEYKLSKAELICYRKRYPDLAKLDDIELQKQWTEKGANQNRDNRCPTVQTDSGLYQYRGAYNDSDIRAIPTRRNPDKSIISVDACAKLAEDNRDTIFGIQNYGECWTGNNESDAYKYGAVYDKIKFNALGTPSTNMVYVRKEAFPDPEPPLPNLMEYNFNDSTIYTKSSEETISAEIIESFSNKNYFFNSDIMNSSEKICGFILLILFIIIFLIIYKVNNK